MNKPVLRWYLLGAPVALAVVALAAGGEPGFRRRPKLPALPDSAPPHVVMAEAYEKGGAVRLRFLIPNPQIAGIPRVIEENGKKLNVTVATTRFNKWYMQDLPVDGWQVQAFDGEGKKLAAKELLTRLKTYTPVVVFKGDNPDPYYLRVLRPDTVVLKGPPLALNPPPPSKD
jgi:hypothetical protein